MVNNGNFTLLLTSSDQQWQFHIATDIYWSTMAISCCYWYLLVNNGNFTLLLTSTGQQWQFHIATDIYWSAMAISHSYWHLMVNNGNFTLLLISSGQQWQFHTATDIYWSRMAISYGYWHLSGQQWQLADLPPMATDISVVNNGNFTLLLTSTGQQWWFHIATDI